MSLIKLQVKTNNQKYPIYIGNNILDKLKIILKQNLINFNQCLVIADKNVPQKLINKVLHFLPKKKVIALGGGAFLNEKIRKEVITNNYSVWLNCDSKTLISRLKNNKKRPLALNIPDNELLELISKRSKIYSKSQFKINCHKLTKNEIVKKIIDLYNND